MASDAPETQTSVPQVILGNGNRRFSGVTSTLLQVLPHQTESMEIAVLGSAHMPSSVRTLSFLSALRLLRRAAMNRKPVVFHARRNIEMVQALLLRCLGASTLKITFTSTAQRYHSRFTRYLMRQMDSVISTCSAAASYLEPPPDQMIPHGIDTARFHPRPKGEPPRREALATAHQIGIFGRVRHQKGIDVLIEAAIPILLERPDWGILVVGEIKPEDASYVDELKRRINEAGLTMRINFAGLQPFSTLPGFFRHSDVVAALSRNEGYGLTVLEAMSSSCAVIASTAGAWPFSRRRNVSGTHRRCGAKCLSSLTIKKRITMGSEALQGLGNTALKMRQGVMSVVWTLLEKIVADYIAACAIPRGVSMTFSNRTVFRMSWLSAHPSADA